MRFSTLFLVFIIYSGSIFSQNIHGTVLEDKTNIPLIGVNIYVKNTKEGTTTNSKGKFILKTISATNKYDSLFISYVGYKTKKITFSELDKNNHIVYLSVDIQNIKEVSVAAKKFLEPRIKFKKLAPLKEGLYATGSLLINNKIYLLGGDLSFEEDKAKDILFESGYGSPSTVVEQLERTSPEFSWHEFSGKLQIYDIEKNEWETSNFEFQKRAYHNFHLYDNKIYVLGGKRLSKNQVYEYLDDDIEVFNLNKDTVLIDYTNPHQAVNFASVIYKDNIIVLGGSNKKHKNGDKEYTNKVHLYNLSSGYWYELKDMPEPKETNGILVNDKVYLFGGFNLKDLNQIESYNLITGEWSHEGELFHDAERPALACNDSIIYIFDKGRISTYNTETKELNEYIINLDLKYSELIYSKNKLYIIGGFYQDETSITPSSDLYRIEVSDFEKTRVKNSTIL